MCYKKNSNILYYLIKAEIILNDKFYKLAIKTYYSNFTSKTRLYWENTSFCIFKSKTNRQFNNNCGIMLIELDLF